MPTDLEAVSARKRKAQTQKKMDITMAFICIAIWLVMLALAFVDQGFAKETIQLMNPF